MFMSQWGREEGRLWRGVQTWQRLLVLYWYSLPKGSGRQEDKEVENEGQTAPARKEGFI